MLATIKKGKSGDTVKIAQYLTGKVARKKASGVFDANLQSYVKAFQTAKGLKADGIAGAKTWAALLTGDCEVRAHLLHIQEHQERRDVRAATRARRPHR